MLCRNCVVLTNTNIVHTYVCFVNVYFRLIIHVYIYVFFLILCLRLICIYYTWEIYLNCCKTDMKSWGHENYLCSPLKIPDPATGLWVETYSVCRRAGSSILMKFMLSLQKENTKVSLGRQPL